MNYGIQLKKFITSQYLYSAVRITVAVVIPALVLANFGLLKEYFLFPLGTSFVGLTDMTGAYHRRRNALILAVGCFIFVAVVATLLVQFEFLKYLQLIVFGIFFSIIGVYGQRFAAIGGLSLVVLSVFLDGHLMSDNVVKGLFVFSAGCIWFVLVFMVVTSLQPYKLALQLVGENYLQLASYLEIKAKFYRQNSEYSLLYREVIAKQVEIKNLQEETREVVFRTRQIVNESTTTSRLLLLTFLNSVDLFEKLLTADQDFEKLHQNFDHSRILDKIHDHLILLSAELTQIGISVQSGIKTEPAVNFKAALQDLFDDYFELRNKELTGENLENFMSLRLILSRIYELSKDIQTVYKVISQDQKLARSLSTGLDYQKFLPAQEKLNLKVLLQNFSLQSSHFRHAIRMTLALLIGYTVSKLEFLGIGHSYWILITVIAILRPAYSTTKHRNLLRLYGTVAGAVLAYALLIFVENNTALLIILLVSMVLCFSLLKNKYAWAVFFMTIYIFITFNFLNPGNTNQIFKDRILDTAIAGVIAFFVSYLVLPVWERSQNMQLMKDAAEANLAYFTEVVLKLQNRSTRLKYNLARRNAIIFLANLSDNFQRMLSDPKNQRSKMESVHQFVTTSHLITAYSASVSQYASENTDYSEIHLEEWKNKISAELELTLQLLKGKDVDGVQISIQDRVHPADIVDNLLNERRRQIEEDQIYDRRDVTAISHLAQLKNIRDILELLTDVAHEQRKVIERFVAND